MSLGISRQELLETQELLQSLTVRSLPAISCLPRIRLDLKRGYAVFARLQTRWDDLDNRSTEQGIRPRHQDICRAVRRGIQQSLEDLSRAMDKLVQWNQQPQEGPTNLTIDRSLRQAQDALQLHLSALQEIVHTIEESQSSDLGDTFAMVQEALQSIGQRRGLIPTTRGGRPRDTHRPLPSSTSSSGPNTQRSSEPEDPRLALIDNWRAQVLQDTTPNAEDSNFNRMLPPMSLDSPTASSVLSAQGSSGPSRNPYRVIRRQRVPVLSEAFELSSNMPQSHNSGQQSDTAHLDRSASPNAAPVPIPDRSPTQILPQNPEEGSGSAVNEPHQRQNDTALTEPSEVFLDLEEESRNPVIGVPQQHDPFSPQASNMPPTRLPTQNLDELENSSNAVLREPDDASPGLPMSPPRPPLWSRIFERRAGYRTGENSQQRHNAGPSFNMQYLPTPPVVRSLIHRLQRNDDEEPIQYLAGVHFGPPPLPTEPRHEWRMTDSEEQSGTLTTENSRESTRPFPNALPRPLYPSISSIRMHNDSPRARSYVVPPVRTSSAGSSTLMEYPAAPAIVQRPLANENSPVLPAMTARTLSRDEQGDVDTVNDGIDDRLQLRRWYKRYNWKWLWKNRVGDRHDSWKHSSKRGHFRLTPLRALFLVG